MANHFAVAFEEDPPEDIVNFAVAPFDAVTGLIVSGKIKAKVTVPSDTAESGELVLPDRPIRNLSGLLVFINLDDYPKYKVTLSAKDAGYFDPEPIEFTPPASDEEFDPKDRLRLDFPLFPLPYSDFSDEATLVSGVVIKKEEKKREQMVGGAKISLEFITPAIGAMRNNSSTTAFETRSDERGAFALALKLPSFLANDVRSDESDVGAKAKFRVETKTNSNEWELQLEWTLQIKEGRQVFKFPINLLDTVNQVSLTT